MNAPVVSPALLAQPQTQTTADLAKRAKIQETAEKFEAQFLSVMLQQMFEGISTDGPFGGGQGEALFRSVMTEAMGREMAKAGGIGVADTVQREMLKLQGLQ
jgi:peptidoglycan hydrolase FlgJ